jgi:hypothetical protein
MELEQIGLFASQYGEILIFSLLKMVIVGFCDSGRKLIVIEL